MKTKEQILADLKSLVLELRYNGKEYRRNHKSAGLLEWQRKNKEFEENIVKMSSSDSLWVNNEYGKWFRSVFGSDVEKLKRQGLIE